MLKLDEDHTIPMDDRLTIPDSVLFNVVDLDNGMVEVSLKDPPKDDDGDLSLDTRDDLTIYQEYLNDKDQKHKPHRFPLKVLYFLVKPIITWTILVITTRREKRLMYFAMFTKCQVFQIIYFCHNP